VPNETEAQKSFWTHSIVPLGDEAQVEACFGPFGHSANLMGLGVVPDLLVSVDKLDLGWIRRWLSDYNDHKVAAP